MNSQQIIAIVAQRLVGSRAPHRDRTHNWQKKRRAYIGAKSWLRACVQCKGPGRTRWPTPLHGTRHCLSTPIYEIIAIKSPEA